MASAAPLDLKQFIRDVPDFPKPGILFRDITPLLAEPDAFRDVVGQLADQVRDRNIEAVRMQLARHGIGIASEEVGGTGGRSVHASIADLEVFVRSGAGEPFKMDGSEKPIMVKVSEPGADLDQEPFPDDIWNSNPVQPTS